jgi:hypothetical protein
MDGQQQTAHLREHQLTVGTTYRPDAAHLEVSTDHPIARVLDRLLIRRQPLFYESCSHLEGILFGPERLTLSLIQRGLHAAEAARRSTPNADRVAAA